MDGTGLNAARPQQEYRSASGEMGFSPPDGAEAQRAYRGLGVRWYHPRSVSVSTGLCHELAALARLSLTDREADLFAGQLGGILQYLQQLQEVDVAGVHETTLHGAQALRADVPGECLDRDLALSQAPAVRAGQVVVPKFKED